MPTASVTRVRSASSSRAPSPVRCWLAPPLRITLTVAALPDPRDEHPTRSYDAIVFDVDGTLYDTWRMRQGLLPIFVRRCVRAPIDALRAARVLRAYRVAHESLRGSKREDLSRAQLQKVASHLEVDIDEVRAVVEDWFERAPLSAVARAVPRALSSDLHRLRASGFDWRYSPTTRQWPSSKPSASRICSTW